MRLTKHTEYALRALIYLGVQPGIYVTSEQISKAYGISNHHLVKIVCELGKEGILEVRRGRQGGVRLARAPEDINLAQLVRMTEPDFQLAECFADGEQSCPVHPACSLVGPLEEARDAFMAVLAGYTLADLLVPPRLVQIRRVLGLPVTEPIGDRRPLPTTS